MKNKEIENKLINLVLNKVTKPGRYIGNEINLIHKKLNQVDVRFLFADQDGYILARQQQFIMIIKPGPNRNGTGADVHLVVNKIYPAAILEAFSVCHPDAWLQQGICATFSRIMQGYLDCRQIIFTDGINDPDGIKLDDAGQGAGGEVYQVSPGVGCAADTPADLGLDDGVTQVKFGPDEGGFCFLQLCFCLQFTGHGIVHVGGSYAFRSGSLQSLQPPAGFL